MSTTTNPRAVQDEGAYLDADLGWLKDELIAAGHTDTTASGIIGWIVDKRRGIDRASSATKARYRKILRELGAGTLPPPDDEAPIILAPRVLSTRRERRRRWGRGGQVRVFGGIRAVA